MSIIMLPRTSQKVNGCRRKMDRYCDPDPATIPSLWLELRGLANIVPEGEQGGIHRLRSMLLRNVPNYMIPQYLDSLAARGAII